MPCLHGLCSGEQMLSPKVNSERWKLTTTLPRKIHPRETHPRKTHPTSPRGGCIIRGGGRAEAGGCPGASCLSHAACTQVLQLPQPSCPSQPVRTGQGTPSLRVMHSSKYSCPLCRKSLTQPSRSAPADISPVSQQSSRGASAGSSHCAMPEQEHHPRGTELPGVKAT